MKIYSTELCRGHPGTTRLWFLSFHGMQCCSIAVISSGMTFGKCFMVGFGGNFERASDTFFLNNSFFSFYVSKIANFLNPSKVEQLILYFILMIYTINERSSSSQISRIIYLKLWQVFLPEASSKPYENKHLRHTEMINMHSSRPAHGLKCCHFWYQNSSVNGDSELWEMIVISS